MSPTERWDSGLLSGTSDAGLERFARFWMRAYPRRWRVFYGDDLVRVLADVTPPGTQRVPAKEAAGIVRAGWALRLREHPPFWKWLGYRTLGFRLPGRYRSWVIDDLLGRFFILRAFMPMMVILLGGISVIEGSRPPLSLQSPLIITLIMFVVVMFLARRFRARNDWRWFIGTEPPIELQPRRERRRAYQASQEPGS